MGERGRGEFQNILRKTAWSLLMFFPLKIFLFIRYFKNTFGTQPFPAITVCSINPIKSSVAKEIPELRELVNLNFAKILFVLY